MDWQAAPPNRQERLNPGMIHDDRSSRRRAGGFDHLVEPGDRPVEIPAAPRHRKQASGKNNHLHKNYLRQKTGGRLALALTLLLWESDAVRWSQRDER